MSTFKARPTTYKGIQMRSRLEAGFATWLDHFCTKLPQHLGTLSWDYEPVCLASPRGQWLPDFHVRGLTNHRYQTPTDYWFDVKPSKPTSDEVRRWSDILADNHPEACCLAATPDGFYGWAANGLYEFEFVAWPSAGFVPRVDPPWQGEWWKGDQTPNPTPTPRPAPPAPAPGGGGAAAEARRRLQAARPNR